MRGQAVKARRIRWDMSARSLQRPARCGRKLADHTVGDLTSNRQLAFAFKPLDSALRLCVNNAACPDLPVPEFGERALYGDYARRCCGRIEGGISARRRWR